MLKIDNNSYNIPENYTSLTNYINSLKRKAVKLDTNIPKNSVKSILVPHAGLTYSGLAACQGYLSTDPSSFDTIIVLSTFHNSASYKSKLYLPKFLGFETPLGQIFNDMLNIKKLIISNSYFSYGSYEMFMEEHSIIHQLPLIQNIFGKNKKIIPILCGNVSSKIQDDDFFIKLMKKNRILVVCNTDLSHVNGRFSDKANTYLDLITKDNRIIKNILDFKSKEIRGSSCCGVYAIQVFKKFLITQGQIYPRIGCYYTSQININNPQFKIQDITKVKSVFNSSNSSVSYLTVIYSNVPYLSLNKTTNTRTMKYLLTRYEELYLLTLARESINSKFDNITEDRILDEALYSPSYNINKSVFVTIKTNRGKLRGCIGTLSIENPIVNNVIKYSRISAFGDSRFKPITSLEGLKLYINILSEKREISISDYFNTEKYVPGDDGIQLVVYKGDVVKSGFFLPSVYYEQKWNKKQQLENLCIKARQINENCYLDKKIKTKLFYMEGFEFTY